MIDEYTNSLLSHCSSQNKSKNNDSSSSSSILERRLKPIQERWQKIVSKRNHGYYCKKPEQLTLNDMTSSLLASKNDVNANLKLPIISTDWINVAIGLILSVPNSVDDSYSISTSLSNNQRTRLLINNIKSIIKEWLASSTINSHNISLATDHFSSLVNNCNDITEQCKYILERILLPLLPCELIVDKIYSCNTCETTKRIRETIYSIPVNVLRTGLHLEHDFYTYFSPISSDIQCESCKRATIRHIEVLKWPPVIVVTVNGHKKDVKSRKPPGIFTLAQFSNWISIGLPSTMVYDLVSFCSILPMENTDFIVRATKIKKSWLTSTNKRLIGYGDQLKRLFAHSRKFQIFY